MPSRQRSVPSALRERAGRGVREISLTLAAVLLVGLGAMESTAAPAPGEPERIAAGSAPSGEPDPAGPVEPRAAPGLADRPVALSPLPSAAPTPSPVAEVDPAPAARERWLPRGTGMWLHDWRRSEQGHANEVVARARKVGLTHLYVQTGSSRKGWIGQEVLSQLLPATKGTDLKVIAWDFPKLDEPEKDARRLARAAFWHRDGVPMVAAVAPDVETAAEGARATPERVRRYYAALRKALPKRTAILATVPWPSEKRTRSYPYATTAPYADAFVPMAYWYNRSPTTVTATSMQWLARFGKPVMPVGQGYDGRLDAPYLHADPAPDRSVAAFSFAARSRGAQSISLWSWQTTGALQWQVLEDAARFFEPPAPVAVPAVVPSPSGQAPDTVPGRKPHKDKGRAASSPSPSP